MKISLIKLNRYFCSICNKILLVKLEYVRAGLIQPKELKWLDNHWWCVLGALK